MDLINDYDEFKKPDPKRRISCDSNKRKFKLIYHYRRSSVIV